MAIVPFGAWAAYAEAASRFWWLNWGVQATCWLAVGLLASRLPRLGPGVRHAILLVSLIAAAGAPVLFALPDRTVPHVVAGRSEQTGPSLAPGNPQHPQVTQRLRRMEELASRRQETSPVGLGLVFAWLLLVLVRLGRLGAGCWLVARWGRGAVPVDRSCLFDACRYHVADIPVFEAEGVRVPTVVGVLRPCILLPRGLALSLSPENLGHVLLHEESHVRRRDPLWLLLTELAHAVLAWHPLAEWSRRSIVRAAEDACDARVLAHGTRETSYARTLLAVLECSTPAARLGVACPLGSAGAELRRRVTQILRGPQPASRLVTGVALGAVTVSGAAATSLQVGNRPALPIPAQRVRLARVVTPITRVAWRPVKKVSAHSEAPSERSVDARRAPGSSLLLSVESMVPAVPELADAKASSPREGRTRVFLLDNSSSMRPFQAEARADILAHLEQLAPGDRFNVVAFAADVAQYSETPLAPGEETVAGVRAWLGALPEAHGSNLAAGMLRALATPDLTSLWIYSDGKPTGSFTDPNSLGELLARENRSHAQVLSIAFGSVDPENVEIFPGVIPTPATVPSVQAEQRHDDDLLP